MNLSAHFTLAELTVSDTAARRGIDNGPPLDAVQALKRTALGLEAVRVRLGGAPVIVTSGYRSLALNRAIGSKDTSQHIKGEAVDFICPRFGTPAEIVAALRDSGIEYDQLILEFAGTGRGWVHCSFSAAPRHMALMIDEQGTRPLWG
jgi:zinc D-Ala-D-Ala carboxypeptidase